MDRQLCFGALKILLVEDHPFQLIGLEMQLNRMGFYCLAQAIDCAEALSFMRKGRHFDLMLCDQHLDDGSGLALIQQAQALAGIGSAIIISGVDDLIERRRVMAQARALCLPVLGFLSKPLVAEEFMYAIRSLLKTAN